MRGDWFSLMKIANERNKWNYYLSSTFYAPDSFSDESLMDVDNEYRKSDYFAKAFSTSI